MGKLQRHMILLLLGFVLLCSAAGCGKQDANIEKLEQFSAIAFTAPNAELSEAMSAVESAEDPQAALADMEHVYQTILGDFVAPEAMDGFMGNRFNELQSRLMLFHVDGVTTAPEEISFTADENHENLYDYVGTVCVTTPETTYEGCEISGQIQLNSDGQILSMTMTFSEALESILRDLGG